MEYFQGKSMHLSLNLGFHQNAKCIYINFVFFFFFKRIKVVHDSHVPCCFYCVEKDEKSCLAPCIRVHKSCLLYYNVLHMMS